MLSWSLKLSGGCRRWATLGALLLVWGWSLALPAATEEPPWKAMDPGPYLSATVVVPGSPTNLAYKGIAVDLTRPRGGQGPAREAVVFDTDLLRYAAGWRGDFLALKGVAYDGEHWAAPQVQGTVAFRTPMRPGWAGRNGFEDPRAEPYGPLPREHGRWKGLYVHGERVVFSYQVGDLEVLDSPVLLEVPGLRGWSRMLQLGPSRAEQVMEVAAEPGGRAVVVNREGQPDPSGSGFVLAVVDQPAEVIVGVALGETGTWTWRADDGAARLALRPSAEPRRIHLALARGPRTALPAMLAALAAAPPAEDLSRLTRGGPAHWSQVITTTVRDVPEISDGTFAVEELPPPVPNPWHSWMRFGGVELERDGAGAILTTWNGDVWRVDGLGGGRDVRWRRIAAGLYQPLGVRKIDGAILALGRDQITRLVDLNGDGETDFYEAFHHDGLVGEHFHEFATDLKEGPDGQLYYVRCARHALPAAHSHHGVLMRVSRDGQQSEVVARGFRAVNGLGVGPQGQLTTVDNQGHWMPANRINWVVPDGWYGNQFAANPDRRTSYDLPLLWVHNQVDRSGGTHLWVPPGTWGFLADRWITVSYGMGQVFLVLMEEVDGVRQGAVTRLPLEFPTGVMRGVFDAPRQSLYVAGLFGWAGNKTQPGGFFRIRPTSRAPNVPTAIRAFEGGVELQFAAPLESSRATDPGSYHLTAWDYRWSEKYGSPDLRKDGTEGRETWTVESVALAPDQRTVFLSVPRLQPVMQYHLEYRLAGADGATLHSFLHGTFHRVPSRPRPAWATEPGRARAASVTLAEERPGLRLEFHAEGSDAPIDVRVSRLPALHVSAGEAPSPRLPPGKFRAVWSGYLRQSINEGVRFRVEGSGGGRAAVRINDRPVVAAGLQAGAPASEAVELKAGLNRLEVEVHGAEGGNEFRLYWSAAGRPEEPVPSTVLVHEGAEPRLQRAEQLRRGRELVVRHQCVACHSGLREGPAGTGLPELAARAPALDGVGGRLRATWLRQWLLDPGAVHSGARMPRLLHGPSADQDARDLVAYLQSTGAPAGPPRGAPEPDDVRQGAALVDRLGCRACHTLPGEPADPLRTSLEQVAERWQPGELAQYLEQPGRHHPWTRMPDFQFTRAEAAAVAAHLLALAPAPSEQEPVAAGDPERGRQRARELGCFQCHDRQGEARWPDRRALALGGEHPAEEGCLASTVEARGAAPEFPWGAGEREAVLAWWKDSDRPSLDRDVAAEFFERQWKDLQCFACHGRDGTPDRWSSLTHAAAVGRATDEEDEETAGVAGSVHGGRPDLSPAGEKLHGRWVEQLLLGTAPHRARPEMQGRMPAFPSRAVGLARGLAEQHGFGVTEPSGAPPDPGDVANGAALVRVNSGLGCVTCHGVGDRPALAGADTATVNFALVGLRLRESYYWRFVRDPMRVIPGTMMPKFIGDDGRTPLGALDGDGERQFAAIWAYLQSLRGTWPAAE